MENASGTAGAGAFVYRQRFTGMGFCGAVMAVISPLLFFWVGYSFAIALRQYSPPPPGIYVFGMVLFSTTTVLGWILMLIGREQFQHFPQEIERGPYNTFDAVDPLKDKIERARNMAQR